MQIIFCMIACAYGQYPYRAARPLYPAVPASPVLAPKVTPLTTGSYLTAQPVQFTPGSYSPPRVVALKSGPYPPAQPNVEGGELSPLEQDQPGPYPKSGVQQVSGGELSPEELEIPRNTQVKIQDKQLQYSHGFSDDKGTEVREQGSLLSTNDGWEYVIAKRGSYSYISPEGKQIKVNYIADHNGFRVL